MPVYTRQRSRVAPRPGPSRRRTRFIPSKAAVAGPGGIGTNLAFWLKGNEIAGSNGDPITTWSDASGNGRDFTQATGGNKPTLATGALNSLNGVDFDGGNDWLNGGDMSAVFASAATFFIVYESDGASQWNLFNTGVGDAYAKYVDNNSYEGLFRTARVNNFPDVGYRNNGPSMMSMVSSASLYKWWRDGKVAGDGTPSFSGGTQTILGAANTSSGLPFDGRVFEVIAYNAALSDADRQTVEAYLVAKWGISRAASSGTPTTGGVAGCVRWLRGDGITGYSNGNPLNRWADESGYARDLIQVGNPPTYVTGAQNSLPGVRFDGSNDQLFGDAAQRFDTPSATTIFIAYMNPSADNGRFNPYWDVSNDSWFRFDGASYMGVARGARVDGFPSSTVVPGDDDLPHLLTIKSSGAGYVVYLNGTSIGSTTADYPLTAEWLNQFTLGRGGADWQGDLFEIVVFDTALGDTDRGTIETYLKTKWGIGGVVAGPLAVSSAGALAIAASSREAKGSVLAVSSAASLAIAAAARNAKPGPLAVSGAAALTIAGSTRKTFGGPLAISATAALAIAAASRNAKPGPLAVSSTAALAIAAATRATTFGPLAVSGSVALAIAASTRGQFAGPLALSATAALAIAGATRKQFAGPLAMSATEALSIAATTRGAVSGALALAVSDALTIAASSRNARTGALAVTASGLLVVAAPTRNAVTGALALTATTTDAISAAARNAISSSALTAAEVLAIAAATRATTMGPVAVTASGLVVVAGASTSSAANAGPFNLNGLAQLSIAAMRKDTTAGPFAVTASGLIVVAGSTRDARTQAAVSAHPALTVAAPSRATFGGPLAISSHPALTIAAAVRAVQAGALTIEAAAELLVADAIANTPSGELNHTEIQGLRARYIAELRERYAADLRGRYVTR